MSRASVSTFRESTNVIFDLCLIGLRESSIASVLAPNVSNDESSITVGLIVINCKEASQEQVARIVRSLPDVRSSIDLMLACRVFRPSCRVHRIYISILEWHVGAPWEFCNGSEGRIRHTLFASLHTPSSFCIKFCWS